MTILAGFLVSCGIGILIGAFNGSLVAIFRVQPMVATLILFTGGRSIAFLVDGKLSPVLANDLTSQIGGVIPGVPIQTPIILTGYLHRDRRARAQVHQPQALFRVGGCQREGGAPERHRPGEVKFLTYMIMGVCTAVAGFIAVTKAGRHDSVNLLKYIELDAILAVAIGGNVLSGGKVQHHRLDDRRVHH
jgi:ribose/xylose/arabinose/galactoside ABC-type transport system permease subunit